MPSHIYTVVGMWEDSIASNLSALELQPDYYHAYDFSVYAALQLAQDAKAKMMIDKAAAIPHRGDRPITAGVYTALAAMPARYVIERGDWAGAAALPVNATKYPQADALTRFTRGIGMARTGDVAGAKRELAELDQLRAALQKSDQAYWADRADEQMRAVSAWITLAEGNKAQAEKLMKSAADSEDNSVKNVLMENRLYPLRELYAELLLESGQSEAALREYEVALRDYPNRYRGFYGAARAAEGANQKAKASGFYAQLVKLTEKADGTRPEVARAKSYIAQK
jgi:tetratricopeptide (TPR) repeat protein